MASRHHSLEMSEIADVTDMLCSFEQHNSCRIGVRARTLVSSVVRTIVLELTAWEGEPYEQEAKCLASVSVICSAMNLRNWNSALIHGMYALDFRLALGELGHAAPQKA